MDEPVKAEFQPYCRIEVITKGGEHYSHCFDINGKFDFDKWWWDRWTHEPMLKVSVDKYIAIDMIASISHQEVWS